MSQTFVEGTRVPITWIKVGPCVITQIKKEDVDGYWAVQIGYREKRIKRITKPLKGHLKAAYKDKEKAARFLREVILTNEPKFKVGDVINVSDIFKEGDAVAVTGISKGKGFAGPVKRHGIKILPRKTRKGRRVVGCIGPWHPARVMWTVPRAGQLGYFARTEYNKQILKIGEDGEEVTPVSGFKRYGKVGKHCILRGSTPGSIKRLIRLRDPIRPKPTEIEELQITYISTTAKN